MTTSDYNADFMPEIQYKPELPEFKSYKPSRQPSQIDRIEQKVDAITELLAVLLDSVQAEAEDHEEQADLDGEIIERVKHEQDWGGIGNG